MLYLETDAPTGKMLRIEEMLKEHGATIELVPHADVLYATVREDEETVLLVWVKGAFYEAVGVLGTQHDLDRVLADTSGRPTTFWVTERGAVIALLRQQGYSDRLLAAYGLNPALLGE